MSAFYVYSPLLLTIDIVRLTRDKRKKIEPIVSANYEKLGISAITYEKIIQHLKFLEGSIGNEPQYYCTEAYKTHLCFFSASLY